ncbi:MAG: DUF1134 domain-containing protein [Hyphomicrobiaceae bacterium]
MQPNRGIRHQIAARLVGVVLTMLGCVSTAGSAQAQSQPQSCTRDAFRKVVDDTGQALRRLHAEAQPRYQDAFRRLKELQGWSEDEHVDRAMALASDQRSEALDAKAADLLQQLDKHAEAAPTEAGDCARLADLEAAAIELQATVRAKTDYTLTRLDRLAREKEAAARTPSPAPSPPQTVDVQPLPAPRTKEAPLTAVPTSPAAPQAKAPPPAPAPPVAKAPATGWTTTTREDPTARERPPSAPPAAPLAMPPPSQDGFSIDEIKEASRGFFGSISSGLAGVIEHAFSKAGRPTGYVLGNEGGGAFIAGVRYGSGTLFTRGGRSREVYWHGPSIGYDFGASGAKTMFLVYNMREDIDIFAGFSGVEGSAYLVGGVGLTFLTDGRVVLAPIRSGIGLRLGANIGYLRFTARPTWNPF